MLKLFGTGKKKKSSRGGGGSLKPGNLKIPIPMINGVQYADMTESQISTLIGGGNKGEVPVKKPVSPISSQRTSNTTNTEKTPAATNYPAVVPSRSISSPPVLVMPKPIYIIPPTRSILRSHDYEKTQVESSEEEENSSSSESDNDEADIIKLFPTNAAAAADQTLLSPNDKSSSEEKQEKNSMATTFLNEGEAIVESPRDEKNHQSVSSVTRTSDDSIRQYISASESPFFSNSSVSNMDNNNSLLNASSSFASYSPPKTTTQQQESRPTVLRNNSNNTSHNPHAYFVSARSFDTDLISNYSPTIEANGDPLIVKPPTPKINDETTTPPSNNAAENASLSSSIEEMYNQNSPTPQEQGKGEKTPARSTTTTTAARANSSSPGNNATIATTIPRLTRVTRPASSSRSSATIGLDVTHSTSLSRLTNNNSSGTADKPRSNSTSEPSAPLSSLVHHQNNNSKTNSALVVQQLQQPQNTTTLENINRKHSIAISDMQNQLRKMALSEDLEELKRTVDRMQQQRASDREEHLTRVQEIMDQINLTKQRLESAITGKLFMEDLLNTNDATQRAINASLSQKEADQIEALQKLQQQQQLDQQQQNKVLDSQQEDYMGKPQQPIMKPSTSASSSRSKLKATSSESLRQQPDVIMSQQQQLENSRPRRRRSNASLKQNQQQQRQEDPYMTSSESYFPDVTQVVFDYLPPQQQQQQYFQPIPNHFKHQNGGMRNYYADMEYMEGGGNRFDPYIDSPRMRNSMRPRPRQRSKSVESQWLAQDYADQQQQQEQQQQQQFQHQARHRQYQQHDEVPYDYIDPMIDYQYSVPISNSSGRAPRSRKSSTHSLKSNLSDRVPSRTNSSRDLQNGYHSAAEEDELADDIENDANGGRDHLQNNNNNRLAGDHTMSGKSNRHNSDGEQVSSQQQQYHRPSRNNSGNRHRRRGAPPPNNMGGPIPPPSLMYHNPAFGPPAPHMSHPTMGMMNEMDRMKLRPPPYGYSNMPPPPPAGNEYYNPYISPQRVSPRMMAAAFTDDQQWNGGPPPHHHQWVSSSNQNMYGVAPPPPQAGPESGNALPNGAAMVANNGLQDVQNENNFLPPPRRYPLPPQAASLQQTPQQSQHGYLSLYTDAPRLYM